jgi:hypothetical protein
MNIEKNAPSYNDAEVDQNSVFNAEVEREKCLILYTVFLAFW